MIKKHDIELHVLERFISEFNPSIKIIEGKEENIECPDFIVELNGKRIGVELTQYHTSKRNKRSEKELMENINREISKQWDQEQLFKAFIHIHFNLPLSIKKSQITSIAKDIVAKLKELIPLTNIKSLDVEGSSVHPIIEEISIYPVMEQKETFASTPGAYQVERLSKSIIQEILDEKNLKLKKYRKDVYEHWLVIYSSLGEFSDVDMVGYEGFELRSQFAKVFYFHSFRNDLIKIQ